MEVLGRRESKSKGSLSFLRSSNMEASVKRKHEDENHEQAYHHDEKPKVKALKASKDAGDDKSLSNFISWCSEHDFQLSSKVTVSRKGSCAQWGMLATEDIAEGYCLFQIPRTALLMPANSDITNIIDIEDEKWTSSNQWIPLLLTLLYETNKPNSKWASYLKLAPHPQAIDLPMFWGQSEVNRLLKGTGVDKAVERDLAKIEADFNSFVLPLQHKALENLRPDSLNLPSFKKMVAFVMAYSFTEPANKEEDENGEEEEDDDDKLQPPMMVPMADLLNHSTENNAKLTFGAQALKMVTTRLIRKGEEVFNTYGQVSNLHLMHMYGFAEQFPHNTNDVVEIPFTRLLEAANDMSNDLDLDSELLRSKWKQMREQELIDEDDVVVLGAEGILNDDICSQVLKVLCMSPAEFEDYLEREGWSDAESDCCDTQTNSLDLSQLPSLNERQKMLLKRMSELHLADCATTCEEAVKKLEVSETLPDRERFALFTVHGQQMLLQRLISACSS